MSEHNDIAGSDDIISLNYESQETLNEYSYRAKQSTNRIDKHTDQAKENQKPTEQVHNEEIDGMQVDVANCSLATVTNELSIEQPPPSIDTQHILASDNPFTIRPPLAQSTLTDESSISVENDVLQMQSSINEEKNTLTESASKTELDRNTCRFDRSTTPNNLRLYISPSTSLLETTNGDDAQSNPINISATEIEENNQLTELNDQPKNEPIDTSDAQASLGSDGDIESHPTSALNVKSTSVVGESPKVSSTSKNLYALSQPATNKFESILAKLTTSPGRQATSVVVNQNEPNITIREEEELFIKESISKIVRRYAFKTDQNGRTISRELLTEHVVEENTTSRIEPWPPSTKKIRHSTSKTTRPKESARKKSVEKQVPKRKAKSLRPIPTVTSPKRLKATRSDDDEVSKTTTNEDSSEDNDNGMKDDDTPTDDVSGDEFIPKPTNSIDQSSTKGSRVFAKWIDGHFYPGVIGNIGSEKFMIDFDDGAKRYIKPYDIISQSYLEVNQDVLAQTQDGYFDHGVIKRLIKKKKTGKLGYVIEKDGKEKWYPLRFISLNHEQAEHLPTVSSNTEISTNIVQGKRKRTLTVPQSPKKRTKSSTFASPNKSQRTNSMDVRYKIQDSIENHGGKVIEKIPSANRRNNVYLLSDIARKTAKFLDAKKFNIPCVNYAWIEKSVQKSEIQDWKSYELVLPCQETKLNSDQIDQDRED